MGHFTTLSFSGLSSFGEEIMNLINSDEQGTTLYIIDEFARTTNSSEGKALYSALLNWFSDNKQIYSFSSTHHEALPLLKNVSYWQMNGLDYEKYKKYYHKDYNSDLNERISLINDFMDYGVYESDKKRDALKIANILGLNSKILEYAEKYIKKQEI
jgi:DNA mismatch repair ATPase MutS